MRAVSPREHWTAAGGFPLRVGPAEGKGNGVFAACTIPEGHFLGLYEGEMMNDEAMNARGVGSYVFDVGNGWSIDARDPDASNWARYMNHSKTHRNVVARVRRGESYMMVLSYEEHAEGGWEDLELDGTRVELYTTRKLQVGEELLLDYGPAYLASMEIVING
ncbi:unnamed protein product [Prorocentrum cordatum]|uniref:SET domain-containing protein n=1 Tax=Prorocentrum cordatum TaxID=2364126 RepID=A0ABN9Q053_9DINO|nr:unnamed protein product [Polarella glacialis]